MHGHLDLGNSPEFFEVQCPRLVLVFVLIIHARDPFLQPAHPMVPFPPPELLSLRLPKGWTLKIISLHFIFQLCSCHRWRVVEECILQSVQCDANRPFIVERQKTQRDTTARRILSSSQNIHRRPILNSPPVYQFYFFSVQFSLTKTVISLFVAQGTVL